MRRQTMHRLFGLLVSILMCSAGWAQSTAQVSGTTILHVPALIDRGPYQTVDALPVRGARIWYDRNPVTDGPLELIGLVAG